MNVSNWLGPDGSSHAIYVRLQSNLETAIRKGELQLGSKLPAERELAQQLQVSRTTVTNAYRELEAKGLVRGFVGRGTYVCAVPEPTNVPFAWRESCRRCHSGSAPNVRPSTTEMLTPS